MDSVFFFFGKAFWHSTMWITHLKNNKFFWLLTKIDSQKNNCVMHILLYRGLKVFFRAIEKLELFFFERRELEFKNRETKKKCAPSIY
jgi:hypothetical protein